MTLLIVCAHAFKVTALSGTGARCPLQVYIKSLEAWVDTAEGELKRGLSTQKMIAAPID